MSAGKWWIAVAAALALAGAAVSLSTAAGEVNVFAGHWTTFDGFPGGVDFRAVTADDGAAGITALHGSPCANPTTYYLGNYHDSYNTGTMAGCTTGSSSHLVGRYMASSGGDIDITYVPGSPPTFIGHYTADNSQGGQYDYTGTFAGHFDGDGCCPGAPPGTTTTTTTPPPPPPGVSSNSTTPRAGTPIDYAAPAPGGTSTTRTPRLGPKTKNLTGEIQFVDNNGNPVPPPAVAALEAPDINEKAGLFCSMMVFDMDLDRDAPVQLPSVAVCVNAVVRILVRADEIRRAREGAGTGARALAGPTCRHLQKTPRRQAFVWTCTATQTGFSVSVRSRSRTRKLRDVFKGTPHLVVARSSLDKAGAADRMQVLWTVSSKR